VPLTMSRATIALTVLALLALPSAPRSQTTAARPRLVVPQGSARQLLDRADRVLSEISIPALNAEAGRQSNIEEQRRLLKLRDDFAALTRRYAAAKPGGSARSATDWHPAYATVEEDLRNLIGSTDEASYNTTSSSTQTAGRPVGTSLTVKGLPNLDASTTDRLRQFRRDLLAFRAKANAKAPDEGSSKR